MKLMVVLSVASPAVVQLVHKSTEGTSWIRGLGRSTHGSQLN